MFLKDFWQQFAQAGLDKNMRIRQFAVVYGWMDIRSG